MSGKRMLVAVLIFLLVVGSGAGFVAAQQTTTVVPPRPIVSPRFEVDVLVDGRPLPEYQNRGRTYIEAIRGEEYEIRLRNRSGDWVAVALSVDGLNTIDASRTPAWNPSKWVIEPYQTITIGGWQMDSDHARKFYFTTERDSYAAKLGQKANLGVISAVFYRERRRAVPVTPPVPYPQPIYRDESRSSTTEAPPAGASAGKSRSSRSREDAATGIGRSIGHDVRYIDMDLESRPVAEVTIRYDYGRAISESNPRYRVRGKRDN